MRVRNVHRRSGEKVELMMTPMIDIVFQLLVFFIMTFKIVSPEGDFNIKMPLLAPDTGPPEEVPPLQITVRLRAFDDGGLRSIQMGERTLGSFKALTLAVIEYVSDDFGPGSIAAETDVELDFDPHLNYEHVMAAITAVAGYVRDGQRFKLIEQIQFAPPREQQAPGGDEPG